MKSTAFCATVRTLSERVMAIRFRHGHRRDALLVERLVAEGAVGLLVVAQPVEALETVVLVAALWCGYSRWPRKARRARPVIPTS